MVFSLLMLIVAQAPAPASTPVVVVLTSRRHGADALAPQVATRVLDTCRREGLPVALSLEEAVQGLHAAGVSDPRSCNGSRACVGGLAVVLGARAVVVGVDVAVVAGQVSIHLEALQAGDTAPLASEELLAPVDGWGDHVIAGVTRFARQVNGRLVLAPALPVDAPLQAAAPPFLVPSLAVVGEPMLQVAPRSRTAAIATAVGAGVAIAVGGALLWNGLTDRSNYQAALFTSSEGALASRLSEPEARALAESSNGKVAGAVVATVVGAALGGVSAYLFTRPVAP